MVAVDSSVLLAIFKGEPDGVAWLDLLARLRKQHRLTACEVVWAEVAPAFADLPSLQIAMMALGIGFAAIDEIVAFRAGELFAAYRRQGGTRQRMIPDFIIAAHAMTQTAGLATSDDGYLRTYLAGLHIFKP